MSIHQRAEGDGVCQIGLGEPLLMGGFTFHECTRPLTHGPIARGQANVHICSCGETWSDDE